MERLNKHPSGNGRVIEGLKQQQSRRTIIWNLLLEEIRYATVYVQRGMLLAVAGSAFTTHTRGRPLERAILGDLQSPPSWPYHPAQTRLALRRVCVPEVFPQTSKRAVISPLSRQKCFRCIELQGRALGITSPQGGAPRAYLSDRVSRVVAVNGGSSSNPKEEAQQSRQEQCWCDMCHDGRGVFWSV